jgi:hypothetical protein
LLKDGPFRVSGDLHVVGWHGTVATAKTADASALIRDALNALAEQEKANG